MINTDGFIKRLNIIFEYYEMSASSFSEKIGVQRSSISHILSGRNNPSLDFVLKVVDVFPEVDLYWILKGQGEFPKKINIIPEKENRSTPTPVNEVLVNKPSITKNIIEIENPVNNTDIFNEHLVNKENKSSKIEKIVMFYQDGSFRIYEPN